MTNNVIIIAGMHRSGTSLTSRIFQDGGLNIGDDLLPGAKDNKYGFFEDRSFQEFHEKVMSRCGHGYLTTNTKNLAFDKDDIEFAGKLVEAKSSLSTWGWKDPRTSLFLEQWDAILNSPKYFFVFRPPHEVVLSLINRAGPQVLRKIDDLFSVWLLYNRKIFEFYTNNRDRAVLCNIHGMLNNTSKLHDILESRMCLGKKPNISSLYDKSILNYIHLPGYAINYLKAHHGEALSLYEDMQYHADIPFSGKTEPNNDFAETMVNVFSTVNNKWIRHADGLVKNSGNQNVIDLEEQYQILLNSKAVRLSNWLKKLSFVRTASSKSFSYGEKLHNELMGLFHNRDIISNKSSHQIAKSPKRISQRVLANNNLTSEVEVNSKYTTEFAHKCRDFYNVLHIYYKGMHGVQSAVAYMPGHKIAIPFNRSLNNNEITIILNHIDSHSIENIVIHGHSNGYEKLVNSIKSNNCSLKLYSIWHGGPSQFSSPIVRDSFEILWRLKKNGRLNKISLVKEGMSVFSSDICDNIVYNFPPLTSQNLAEAVELDSVLIPLRDIYRKNMYSNILGAYACPDANKIYCTADFSTFKNKLKGKELVILNKGKGITRDEIFSLYPKIGLTLNITLAECQPMVLLEALAFGTPCLIGPNYFGALNKHAYKELIEVVRPDILTDISSGISRIINYRKNDPSGLNAMMIDFYNHVCKNAEESYLEMFH